jgi:replicative DNA helicase
VSKRLESEEYSALPTSLHAERTILGAMMLEPLAVMDAKEILEVGDFSLESHRSIYRAMLEVMQDGMDVDQITVVARLRQHQRLAAVGGRGYVLELTEGIPRKLAIDSYIRIVKEKSLLRRTMYICDLAMQRCADDSENPMLIMSETEAALQKAITEVHQDRILSDQVQQMVEDIERRRLGEKLTFVTSGCEAIDETHGGYALGELMVIAARPGVGKSSLLRMAVVDNCLAGNHSHLFTPEMTYSQVLQIFVARGAAVPFRRLRHAERLTVEDMANIKAAAAEMASWPLTIDDSSPITAPEIITRARSVKRRQNTKLMGIDYLQKIKYAGKSEFRHMAITDALVGLTSLGKNEQIAIVAISSLTEPGGKEINRVPTAEDLRGSGDIKFEANSIILLHRERDADTQKLVPECSLIFNKARSDGDGIKKIYFDPDYIRFMGQQAFLKGLGK